MIMTLECNHLLTSNKSRVVCFSSTFNLKLYKMIPQGDKVKNDEFSIQKMATKGQICDGSISKKNYVTRSTTCMESFIIALKSAQLLHYVALLI